MQIIISGKSLGKIYGCEPHFHKNWEVVVVEKGEGTLISDMGNLEFQKGTVYFMPPNTYHRSKSIRGFRDIFFTVDMIDLPDNKITCFNHNTHEFISLGKMIYSVYLKKEQGYSSTLNSLGSSFCRYAKDILSQKHINSFTYKIREYLTENFQNSAINMHFLEKEFLYNDDYIRRCFKNDFGVTPMEYLLNIRLGQAKDILTAMPFYTIENVAHYIGFKDKFYFSRVFKENTGFSPTEYRKHFNK